MKLFPKVGKEVPMNVLKVGGSSGTMEFLLGTWTTRRKPWEAIVMKKQVSLRRALTKRLLMIT